MTRRQVKNAFDIKEYIGYELNFYLICWGGGIMAFMAKSFCGEINGRCLMSCCQR